MSSATGAEHQAALSAAAADMVRPEQANATPSQVASALFSSDVMGEIQPDGSVQLTQTNVPVWVVRYDDFVVGNRGPKAAAGSTASEKCPFYVFIDKRTKKVIVGTSACDLETG